MSRKKYKNNCKSLANQYLTLVTIYAAIRGRCEVRSEEDFEVDVDKSTITSLINEFQRGYKGKNNKFKK